MKASRIKLLVLKTELLQTFLTENQNKYGYKIKNFADGASMYDSLNTGAIDAVMMMSLFSNILSAKVKN